MDDQRKQRLLNFLQDSGRIIAILARVEGIAEDPMSFLHSSSREDRKNFLSCMCWYGGLPEGQKAQHPEVSRALQDLLDALVEILQQGITRNSAEVTEQLKRFGSPGELWRKGAGETIWLIMKTDPNITFLSRPPQSYQGVPAELVAWVLGVDVEDFYRFRRELPEAARSTWDFGLSYMVIDDITRMASGELCRLGYDIKTLEEQEDRDHDALTKTKQDVR